MRDQARTLQMFEETRAEADAFMRAFDQARNISHHKRAPVTGRGIWIGGDHAEMRFQGGERIGRDFRTRGRDARNQRGFYGVRETDETDVRQQLQFKPQREFFAGLAIFVLAWSLMPGPDEMRIAIAAAAVAALGREIALARLGQIEELVAGIQIEDNSADGYFEHQIVRRFSGAIRAFAVAAANGFEFAIVPVSQQRVVVRIGFDIVVAALASITAGRAAA